MSLRQRLAQLRHGEEQGAILVITAIVIILLFVLAAIAVDLSVMSQRRQNLWNSADAAALAGASQLPDDPAAAESLALAYAAANDPDLGSGLNVTFRCVVGDRDGDGQPDAIDVPFACDPDPGSSAPPAAAPAGTYVCDNGVCVSACNPNLPQVRCNTLVLEADKTVPYNFAPVIGIDNGETKLRSAACRGTCGQSIGGPIDLMMIIDRTGSMSGQPIVDARDAAKAVLNFLDPALQHVGLGVLPAGSTTNPCNQVSSGGTWVAAALSDDYKDNPDVDVDGLPGDDLDSSSLIYQRIECLNASGATDLGSPINDTEANLMDAMEELTTNGRAGVPKGIILLSDGKANRPSSLASGNHCQYAEDRAADAKAASIEIVTIGFGIASKTCTDDTGTYTSAPVSQLLATMASGTNASNCLAPDVNSDGDNFFCEPQSGDLTSVFLAAAAQLSSGSRLVYLPDGA